MLVWVSLTFVFDLALSSHQLAKVLTLSYIHCFASECKRYFLFHLYTLSAVEYCRTVFNQLSILPRQDLVTDNGQNLFGYGPGKPDIGQPKRVLLRPGDACIAHQRLGHSGGVNLHADPRIQLYFRVSHKNHDDCLEQILEGSSVFLEFEGIKELVGNL